MKQIKTFIERYVYFSMFLASSISAIWFIILLVWSQKGITSPKILAACAVFVFLMQFTATYVVLKKHKVIWRDKTPIKKTTSNFDRYRCGIYTRSTLCPKTCTYLLVGDLPNSFSVFCCSLWHHYFYNSTVA